MTEDFRKLEEFSYTSTVTSFFLRWRRVYRRVGSEVEKLMIHRTTILTGH